MQQSLTTLIALACVIPLIFLTLWLFKKTMAVRLTGNQDIKIINQLSIGTREKLLLLQVNTDVLLIGVTPQQISTLHVCSTSTTVS